MRKINQLLLLLAICWLTTGAASRTFTGEDTDEVTVTSEAALVPGTNAWSTVSFFNGGNTSQATDILTKAEGAGDFTLWGVLADTISAPCNGGGTGKKLGLALIDVYSSDMWCANSTSDEIDAAWHVVGLTRPSTDTDPTIYLDGGTLAVTEITDNGTKPQNVNTTNDWAIGNRGGSNSFNGDLSHMLMYNRQITASEFAELRYKPGMVPEGLVVWIPVWGDSTEPDLSGNGRTGAVTGTTTSSDGPPIMFGGGLPL